jgi:hypothetical protein
MPIGHPGPVTDSAAKGRKNKPIVAGATILSGIVLVGLVTYVSLKSSHVKPPNPPAREFVAELVSATGMVLAQNPGKAEWREVTTGSHFSEGDLVRTDSSGEAGIRYKNGSTVLIPQSTVFTVRGSGHNQMEISAPPDAAMLPLLLAEEKGNAANGSSGGPFIELQQIIPFGRSLELIGRVEAGSSLAINDDIVEVSGEGFFKHFTKPFAASAQLVRLSLRVTDLAGSTRIYTATHDFRPHGGGH